MPTDAPLNRVAMEVAIERLFSAGVRGPRLLTVILYALTPEDVSRQEVAFNVALIADERATLTGPVGIAPLVERDEDTATKSAEAPRNRKVLRRLARQMAAIACYFVAIYVVGVAILAYDIGLTAAIPLAVKTCAGKSVAAALIAPFIHRITGAKP